MESNYEKTIEKNAPQILSQINKIETLRNLGTSTIHTAKVHKKSNSENFLKGFKRKDITSQHINRFIVREDGSKLLHLLAENGLMSHIEKLEKKYTLDLKVKNNKHQTPFMVASEAKHTRVAKLLFIMNAHQQIKTPHPYDDFLSQAEFSEEDL